MVLESRFGAPVSRAFELTQVELAGDLHGLETTAQRNLKLLPYVVGGFTQNYALPDDQTGADVDGAALFRTLTRS